MTYRGTIRNGSVVLDTGVDLPNGAEVEVALAEETRPPRNLEDRSRQIWETLRELPDQVSFDDVIEEVYLLYKIERGVRQLDAGLGVAHEEARRRFREWLE